MGSETKNCQNCKASFEIDASDFEFYKKIEVPPPTFCPNCRLQRRLAFFNLINLYKRPCDLCGKDSMCAYPPEAPYKVYCPPCWWSDKWDPFEYGRDYDFSRPFFEQFNELLHEVPHLGLLIESNVFQTSPYTNYAGSLKNCYLVFNAEFDEFCENGYYLLHNNTTLDTSLAVQCENLYDSMHVWKVNGGVGLRYQVTESLNCLFLRDCRNCQDCFASAKLRNKKYYIFNKPHTKDEYFEEIKKWDFGSYAQYQEIKKQAETHWDSLPYKAIYDDMSVNSSGNLVFESKNCKNCFEITEGQDSRYIHMVGKVKDSYDITSWSEIERCYDSFCIGRQAVNVRFSFLAALSGSNVEYCGLQIEGHDFFGSACVKKGEYVILNKRYSKEDFLSLRAKIIEHMNEVPYVDKKGRVYKYGEFFPIEFSPWAYNETLAGNMFPLSKEKTNEAGYGWREKETKTYTITMKPEDLPDHIKDANESLLKEIIGCIECGRGFKITSSELSFLKNRNFPLPRRCPFCRINEKVNIWFNELKLIAGNCSKCGVEMQIPQGVARKPTIYCKQCYNSEVA